MTPDELWKRSYGGQPLDQIQLVKKVESLEICGKAKAGKTLSLLHEMRALFPGHAIQEKNESWQINIPRQEELLQ